MASNNPIISRMAATAHQDEMAALQAQYDSPARPISPTG